jgi:predicted DNA-binding antitoxin AbrB/MazE fold protein
VPPLRERHVENGVVVFNQPVSLPNGTPVRVEVVASGKTLAERFKNVIGKGVDLPEDLAKNHDQYLHGTPKQ